MSESRRFRREVERGKNPHIAYLGELLGRFYEFLSGFRAKTAEGKPVDEYIEEDKIVYKPSDEQVRSEFKYRNNQWLQYCDQNQLMNTKHLFKANVAEAWNRHSQPQKK